MKVLAPSEPATGGGRVAALVLLVLALAAAAWLLPQAARRVPAESALSRVEHALQTPTALLATPAQWAAVLGAMERAQAGAADNPQVVVTAARLHRTAVGLRAGVPEDVVLGHLALALSLPRQAAQMRPADARTWATWAHSEALAGAADPMVWQAFERAYALAPLDTHVRRLLKEGALVAWAGNRPPEAAAWLQRLYRDSKPEDQQRLARAATELGFELSEIGVKN